MKAMPPEECLDVAIGIGERLVERAVWNGEACSWSVRVPNTTAPQPGVAQDEEGGPLLYQGSAGIALFFCELRRLTGEPRWDPVLAGALQHCLPSGREMLPGACGLHNGRVGIAYAAARVGQALQRPELLDSARELIEPLAGQSHHDHAFDVIGGAAGAIPGLLAIGQILADAQPLEIARELGERLIDQAHREPEGWSWRTVGDGAVRHLTGLAHGTAGIALALLELACATGDSRFRLAAELAFLNERQHFNATAGNWPDLRHTPILDALYYGQMDELRRSVAAGDVGTPEPRASIAWCHGAPGIGLSRLRAFELTGQLLYRQEAQAAIETTLTAILSLDDNYSLCHGLTGNCDLLIEASRRLADAPNAWRQAADLTALQGRKAHASGDRPWPCGTLDLTDDPSLLLGEAGIGYFYLRLASADVSSILLLHPTSAKALPAIDAGYEALAQEYVDGYFGRTRRAFHHLGLNGQPLAFADAEADADSATGPLTVSPVHTAHEALQQVIDAASGPQHKQLADAFDCERQGYEMSRAITDFTTEYLASLVRPAAADIDWPSASFRLAEDARLVDTRWDWWNWLSARDAESAPDNPGDETLAAAPDEDESTILLYRQDNRIHARPVRPLPAILLEALSEPTSMDGLIDHVAAAVGGTGDADRPRLQAMVRRQIEELYQAGHIDLAG
ncbi:MAG: lanthionine synthetase LanC family protein [Acidobacteriota bacterium]